MLQSFEQAVDFSAAVVDFSGISICAGVDVVVVSICAGVDVVVVSIFAGVDVVVVSIFAGVDVVVVSIFALLPHSLHLHERKQYQVWFLITPRYIYPWQSQP